MCQWRGMGWVGLGVAVGGGGRGGCLLAWRDVLLNKQDKSRQETELSPTAKDTGRGDTMTKGWIRWTRRASPRCSK
jgi:hypothetical protein